MLDRPARKGLLCKDDSLGQETSQIINSWHFQMSGILLYGPLKHAWSLWGDEIRYWFDSGSSLGITGPLLAILGAHKVVQLSQGTQTELLDLISGSGSASYQLCNWAYYFASVDLSFLPKISTRKSLVGFQI